MWPRETEPADDYPSRKRNKETINAAWSPDAEAETPILWPPDVKSQFIGKDPDAAKDWEQEKKGATEAEMARWLGDAI